MPKDEKDFLLVAFETSPKRKSGGGMGRPRKMGHDKTAGKQLGYPWNVQRQPETGAGEVKGPNAHSAEDSSEANNDRACEGHTEEYSTQKEENEERGEVME